MLSSGFSTITSTESLSTSDMPAYDCNYSITATYSNVFGQEFSETRSFSLTTLGPEDCEGAANYHVFALTIGVEKW